MGKSNLGKSKKPVLPPLNKEKKKTRAQELAFRAKKAMASKVATTVGKGVMKSSAPEEVTNLVKSVKTLVEKQTKSSKAATDVENNIMKLGIKAYFIIDDGRMKLDDLLLADKPLRQALELLSKCYDHARYSKAPNKKALLDKFNQIQKLFEETADILARILKDHMSEKNIGKLRDTLGLLGNAEFLAKVFDDETLDEPLQDLISAAEHYTQFHFYAEK